ncbi:RNA-splicing ligase RtcB [Phycisphaerales bacterium]|nr:RNA-splicing ligase RtcB [Phycisphaerales bacterium]
MSDCPKVRTWLAERLSPQALRQVEQVARAPDVKLVAVMPDAHAGEHVCNGCVVATRQLAYPHAVGGDIGCGFTAAPLGIDAGEVQHSGGLERVLRDLERAIPILKHPSRARPALPEALEPSALSDSALSRAAMREGTLQLATLGRGNHFIELLHDDRGELWTLVHSGSRAMGQIIIAHHLRRAQAVAPGLSALETNEDSGRAYLADVVWATAYARENRVAILRAVAGVLGNFGAAMADSSILDAPHNTLTREVFDGVEYFVHRKGANTAARGSNVIVAGSSGTFSVIGEGLGCEDSLRSCSHGAGRRLSRTQAAQEVSPRELHRELRGLVWSSHLASRLTTEAPSAYRDLRLVMEAQRDLVRTRLRLRPLLSFKGT